MPREDPKETNISFKTWCYRGKKGHGPVICYRGNKEIRLLALYYSQLPRKQAKSRQRRKGSKTVSSQDKPLFAAEKERRSTRIVLGLIVSMTKWFCLLVCQLVCYISITKGGNAKTVLPKKISSKRGLRTFLVRSYQHKIAIPWCLSTKPQETISFSLMLPFPKQGSHEKVKIEGKICSERAAKAMEKKTVYNHKKTIIKILQKPRQN